MIIESCWHAQYSLKSCYESRTVQRILYNCIYPLCCTLNSLRTKTYLICLPLYFPSLAEILELTAENTHILWMKNITKNPLRPPPRDKGYYHPPFQMMDGDLGRFLGTRYKQTIQTNGLGFQCPTGSRHLHSTSQQRGRWVKRKKGKKIPC